MIGVAGQKRQDIEDRDLRGFKYFKKVRQLLERLHKVGCENDRAHNRDLHMDEYITLLLLYLFNPICVSLRAIQQASGLKKVQRVLGVPRSSLTSLSEASRVFDSEWLLGVIQDLGAELKPLPHDARLDAAGYSAAPLFAAGGAGLRALPPQRMSARAGMPDGPAAAKGGRYRFGNAKKNPRQGVTNGPYIPA